MQRQGFTEGPIKTALKKFLLVFPGFQTLCRRLSRHHVRAVMYHRFSPEGRDHPRHLRARDFAWQLAYLKRHHVGWTPDQQLENAGRPLSLPGGPPVVITVDDGYADFETVAFPQLRKHDLPATVFVTTDFVSGRTWFWWDRLMWLLENCPSGDQEFLFTDRETQGDPGDEDQRWKLWHTIADRLSTIGDDEKENALLSLAKDAGLEIPEEAPEPYGALNWDQIRTMANQGVGFGAHTVSHPVLSRVDAERAEHEIRASGEQLSVALGTTPGWFCYPQGGPGDFGPDTVEMVRHAGFRGCYTAFPDPHHDGDPMTLPRYSISGNRTSFQWIMCGAEYLFTRSKSRTRTSKGAA